jgi:hypothetical protein
MTENISKIVRCQSECIKQTKYHNWHNHNEQTGKKSKNDCFPLFKVFGYKKGLVKNIGEYQIFANS